MPPIIGYELCSPYLNECDIMIWVGSYDIMQILRSDLVPVPDNHDVIDVHNLS